MHVPTSAVEYYLIETTNIMYEKVFSHKMLHMRLVVNI